MQDLYVLNEIFTNGLNYNLLTVISLVSVLSGVLVVISKNPIVSVLFLIGLFLSIAGYLLMLGINFIGLSYLLVYVGAVSILFLFILMLINVRISELTTNSSNSIPLAIMIGVFFYVSKVMPDKVTSGVGLDQAQDLSVYNLISYVVHVFDDKRLGDNVLYYASSSMWDGRLAETFHITSIGNIIYTSYPVWLILTSVILLLAMVGSILITMQR